MTVPGHLHYIKTAPNHTAGTEGRKTAESLSVTLCFDCKIINTKHMPAGDKLKLKI